jgi:ATP-dependent DNA helicase RecQ
MPTGGKSLCYHQSAVDTAIVVSPLINENQVDAIRSLSSENGVAHVLNSSLTKTEITQEKKILRLD